MSSIPPRLSTQEVLDRPRLARQQELLAALPADAVISHRSAIEVYGLPTLRSWGTDDRLEITLSPRSVLPRRRAVVTHGRLLLDDDVTVYGGLRVTSPQRLYVDAAEVVATEDLIVLGDAMLQRELTTGEQLAGRTAAARALRGVRRARQALPLLDGRAQSPPESLLRVRLGRAGHPAVPQCPVHDGHGRVVAHLDLGYPAQLVGVEYEGRNHAEVDRFGADIDRHALLASLGWLVVRASARDLRWDSRLLVSRVAAALRYRGNPRRSWNPDHDHLT